MKVLVTGTAGFIGAAVAERLLARGDQVIGVDNLNDYYDVSLKEARLARLLPYEGFNDVRLSLEDEGGLKKCFESNHPDRVLHLAAQAGVRYSIENPEAYVNSNLIGFFRLIEACRQFEIEHFVYASSSSVYGSNTRIPFSVDDNVDHPVSLYAATKKSNELIAHSYSHLYSIPTTGLRFFTVYGPWGRPDMSPFIFVKKILAGDPIDVFNHGQHKRDFTYIDDIVDGVVGALDSVATPNLNWSGDAPSPASSLAPYRLHNIGCHQPVELLRYIEVIGDCLGKKPVMNMLPLQPGDVLATYADIDSLTEAVGFRPKVSLEEGISRFVSWYRDYYDERG
ncbi:MAG: capsular biosynthesis protein CpsI [Deltaproteobacteria bacterium]|nr:capsular biosynthesis protein CpsI [Deltaproteobacteria bacterium]